MKTNLAVVISGVDYRYIAFEWFVKYIDKSKFNVIFIAIDCKSETFNSFLDDQNIPAYRLNYQGSGKISLVRIILKVYKILRSNKIDVIHSHVFDANLISQTAAFLARVKRRIYTRHYSTSNHMNGSSRVKWDKLINRIATNIVAISLVVKETLLEKEGVPEDKVKLIHHGFDLQEFESVSEERIEIIRTKYAFGKAVPIVGVVSTFQKLKGIEYIIGGFSRLLDIHPNAILVLANAKGKDEREYYKLLEEKLHTSNYRTIKFEDDIAALFATFDIFVHAPINREVEGFGQVYIEAMASGVPVVTTLSGIAVEIFSDNSSKAIAEFKDEKSIYEGVKFLTNDKTAREEQTKSNYKIVQDFNIQKMMNELESLYIS